MVFEKIPGFSFLNFQDQLPLHLHQHFTATAPRDGAAAPRFLPRFDVTNSSSPQPLEPVNLKLGG